MSEPMNRLELEQAARYGYHLEVQCAKTALVYLDRAEAAERERGRLAEVVAELNRMAQEDFAQNNPGEPVVNFVCIAKSLIDVREGRVSTIDDILRELDAKDKEPKR